MQKHHDTPARPPLHLLTGWDVSGARRRPSGVTGHDLLLGAARLVGRPVGGVTAREHSGSAGRDEWFGLVETHRNRHTDGGATRDERDALRFETCTLVLARTTGNRRYGQPPPRARETRHTGRAQPRCRSSALFPTRLAHPLSAALVDAAQPAHQPPAAAATSPIAAGAMARIFYGSWGPGPVLVHRPRVWVICWSDRPHSPCEAWCAVVRVEEA